MENLELWHELLDYARWVPSPHNVQTWKVKLRSATEADLFYDPRRLLPKEDPSGRFLMTGFGIFLEALNIAAGARQYAVESTFLTEVLDDTKSDLVVLAHLVLVPASKPENLSRELIKQRRTSRLPYTNRTIDPSIITELQSLVKSFGHALTVTAEPTMVDWTLQLNRDTMFYDMNDDAARNEVGLWARFSKTDALMKKDGLWSYCMNTPAFLMYLFFNARWVINIPGIYHIVRAFYLRTTSTTTVAWIQGPFRKHEDWVTAGKMLLRYWLTLTKHDIYLHPFGSIITNPIAHQRLQKKLAVDENTNDLWLIMRLGYSEQPPRSVRLDLADIIIP